jgi:hypothetical protein
MRLILCACMCVKEVDCIERRTNLNIVFFMSYLHKEKVFKKRDGTQDFQILSLLCYHIGCYEGIIIKKHLSSLYKSKNF